MAARLLFLLVVLLVVWPASAQAGILTRSGDGKLLAYNGAAGEIDAFTLSFDLFNPTLVLFVPLAEAAGESEITFAPGSGCGPSAGSGEVQCTIGTIERVQFDLGDGDDRVLISSFDPTDPAADFPKPVTIIGGDGADTLTGGPKDDLIIGGNGPDILFGDPGIGSSGNDDLHGDPGRDTLDGGGGADHLQGGGGFDLADYRIRGSQAVEVTLDGQANDGNPLLPERDNVHVDVEDVRGTNGADRLVGSSLANQLSGGPGGDQIDGGGGQDMMLGEEGNDTLLGRDGNGERVDCGEGTDFAFVDEIDEIGACEASDRSAALQPDGDRDGAAKPVDCDDADANVRPGATDAPGNGRDEDCDGADAIDLDVDKDGSLRTFDCDDFNAGARPGGREQPGNLVDEDCSGRADPLQEIRVAVQNGWLAGATTRARTLRVRGAPVGATVSVRCSGRGCPRTLPRAVVVSREDQVVSMLGNLRRARLRSGAVVEIRVTKDGSIGQAHRYRIRRARVRRASRCAWRRAPRGASDAEASAPRRGRRHPAAARGRERRASGRCSPAASCTTRPTPATTTSSTASSTTRSTRRSFFTALRAATRASRNRSPSAGSTARARR